MGFFLEQFSTSSAQGNIKVQFQMNARTTRERMKHGDEKGWWDFTNQQFSLGCHRLTCWNYPSSKIPVMELQLISYKNTFYRFAAKEFWQMVLDLWAYQETEIHKKEDFQPNFPVIWFDTWNFYISQSLLLMPTLKIIYTWKMLFLYSA